MANAIRTKVAPILWNDNNKVKVYYYGDKSSDDKAIWYDDKGCAYEMIYARLAKQYSLNPCPLLNKEV